MPRSNISFVLSTQNIGQAALGNDFISGECLYGTAPGSFATTPYQAVFSVSDAESKGIALDYADETKATATLVISATGATGDIFLLQVSETNPVTPNNPTGSTLVTLCTYVQQSTDTTATILAASIAAAVTANSYQTASGSLTGYTATAATGTITVTGRQRLGINLNTKSLIPTITGTITTGTNTAFSGGVYSKKALWHYIVSEFFRANATGVLWLGFFATPNFTSDCITLNNAASGAIKQFGVFDPTVTSAATFTSNGTLLQAQMVSLFGQYNPAICLYTANLKAVSDISTLQNQQLQNNYYISHVIMQDGGAAGAQLYINSGVSVGNIGCALGTVSAAAVNQDIGEIGAFNITDSVEMSIPAFINGVLVSATASNLLDQLDAYRYIFATPQPNITGTYIVNDWSSINQTSPYFRISRNRTMNKAIRLVYANLIPLLKSIVSLNTDGTIDVVTLAKFNGAIIPVQTQMKNAGEISNLKVTINASQNIISAGKLVIGVAIQPTLIADFIEVDMSFVAKIS